MRKSFDVFVVNTTSPAPANCPSTTTGHTAVGNGVRVEVGDAVDVGVILGLGDAVFVKVVVGETVMVIVGVSVGLSV